VHVEDDKAPTDVPAPAPVEDLPAVAVETANEEPATKPPPRHGKAESRAAPTTGTTGEGAGSATVTATVTNSPPPPPPPQHHDEEKPKVTVETTVKGDVEGGYDQQEAQPRPSDETVAVPKKDPEPTPAQLLAQARASAKKGDCKRVAALGAQVKALDATYYANTFETDAAIRGCRK
jgi:hypothetical protein